MFCEESQTAIPRRGGSNTGVPRRSTDDGLPLGADKRPQRESRWQVARRPTPGCCRREGNTRAECLLSVPCLVRQFHVALAHQLSVDPALFKALKPSSSLWIPMEKLSYVTFSFSGLAPWFLYCFCIYFSFLPSQTEGKAGGVCWEKIDGWAPVVPGAMWLNEGIFFLWLHTYRALSLLKAQRTILALISPQQDAIRFKEIQFQKGALKKIIVYSFDYCIYAAL